MVDIRACGLPSERLGIRVRSIAPLGSAYIAQRSAFHRPRMAGRPSIRSSSLFSLSLARCSERVGM